VDPVFSEVSHSPLDIVPQHPEVPPPAELPLKQSAQPDLSSMLPKGPSRLEELQGQYDKLNAPMTGKQRLIQGIASFAPIALGGIFGGTYGASGAAEGVTQGLQTQLEQHNLQRKSLLTEMENERQRQERGQERQISAEATRYGAEERLQGQREIAGARRDVAGLNAEVGNLRTLVNAQTAANKQTSLDAVNQRKLDQADQREKDLNDLRSAQKELMAARADSEKAKNDPNSPAFRLAQERVRVAEANHATASERLGLSEKQFELRSQGTVNGVAPPGSLQTDSGQPVGTAFQQNVRPTGQERNKADMAASAKEQLDDIRAIVKKRPDIFGPVAGRTTDFTVWVGSQDPDAQAFRAARTIAGDHLAGTFGGRSEAALQALDNAIGQFKDNPKALEAGLDQIEKAAGTFVNKGTVKTVGSKAAGAKVQKWGRDAQGRPVPIQ
jgi:hypothetical protein